MFGKCKKKKKVAQALYSKRFYKINNPTVIRLSHPGNEQAAWGGSWGDVHSNGTLKSEKEEVAHNPTHGSVTGAETLGGILCSHSKRLFFSVIFTER